MHACAEGAVGDVLGLAHDERPDEQRLERWRRRWLLLLQRQWRQIQGLIDIPKMAIFHVRG